jgi:hypothetical protein
MPDVKATTLTITMIAENKFTSLNIDAPPVWLRAMGCYSIFGYDSPTNLTVMMRGRGKAILHSDLSFLSRKLCPT